jgi:CelD/BcsL family acetyltransferase involved in cellulose biosynthesis
MEILEINTLKDFLSLKERWNRALDKKDHSIFQTWDWLSLCWKHFGSNKQLMLLLAMEKDEIIGIAPLMYSVHSMFGVKRAKIEFMDGGLSDYNDFVLIEKEEECLDLFLKYLTKVSRAWDCIELSDIPENSVTIPYLKSTAKNLRIQHVCPYIKLPKSYDEYFNSLKYKQRKDIRRTLRRLEEKYSVEFSCYSGECSIEEGINIFFDLHQKRWISQGQAGVFSSEQVRRFHTDIAKTFFDKGWLGLYCLKVSGRPVAAIYGFRYRSKYCAYLTGFDPKYFSYNVGSLLFAYAIADCIRQGLTEFDFLRGAEEYKNRWNTKLRFNYQATLIRNGFLPKIENCLYTQYWRQGVRLKYMLKLKNIS